MAPANCRELTSMDSRYTVMGASPNILATSATLYQRRGPLCVTVRSSPQSRLPHHPPPCV